MILTINISITDHFILTPTSIAGNFQRLFHSLLLLELQLPLLRANFNFLLFEVKAGHLSFGNHQALLLPQAVSLNLMESDQQNEKSETEKAGRCFRRHILIFKDWMPAFPTIFFYWCFAMLVLGKFLMLTRMVVVLTMTSLVMLTRMVAVVVVGMSPTLKMELQSLFFTCPPLQELATNLNGGAAQCSH